MTAAVSTALRVDAQSLWTAVNGISANTNWSTAANWSSGSVPSVGSNVLFLDTAVTLPGTIDNVVDVNATIQRLAFEQTNGIHNTLILPGVTLTISNSLVATNLLIAGTENAAGSPTTLIVTNTISGAGGTLLLTSTNNGSSLNVRQITTGAAGAHLSVLDLSGLDNFNATAGNFYVGVFGGTGTTRPQGVLFLAKTNTITLLTSGTKLAPALDVGDTGSSPDVGNTLLLGITNRILADSIVIGNQRSGGTLMFNPAFTNVSPPSLYLRGNTNSRVAVLNISDNSSATANIGSVTTGSVDFTGGTVDALVDFMTLGDGQPIAGSGAGTSRGTLTMTAGILNVNTMELGFQNNTGAAAANTGIVNINGGTNIVNVSMRLAKWGGAGGLSTGTLNITNGTVMAANLVAGGGASTINMSGGILIVSNAIASPASQLSALNLSSTATLQFQIAAGLMPASVTNLAGDGSGIIKISSLPALAGYPSTFPLISYQNGTGVGLGFSLGSLPGTFTGYISNDNSSAVWVVITNGPSLGSVTWGGGVNNLWDTNSSNWTNNSSAVKYKDPDVVTFDDSGKTSSVSVTGTFAPAAWLQQNNTKNYAFSGPGSITGSCGLVMDGTGSVTLAETGGDNFSGGVKIDSGTVILDDANCAIAGGMTIAAGAAAQIGNNDTNGALPSGTLHDDGTLIFSRSDNVQVGIAIPGAGALVKNGNGTLTLNAANSYTGNTTINGGTLALTNSASLSSSAQVNATGGTLDVSSLAGVTTLAILNLTNAGLTVSTAAFQPNLTVASLNLGGAGNTINVSSIPAVASYPTTLPLVQSASPVNNFNLAVGTLPAGYTGTVALSPDQTTVLLTLTGGPVGVRASVTWTGGDSAVTTNWSDNLNWQLPGAPIAMDNVVFNNTATAPGGSDLSFPGGGAAALIPGNINNFVNANFAIASLTYTNNGGSYENTAIADGTTLAVTNSFTIGAVDSASILQQQYVNISGGGNASLTVNNTNSNLQVWIGNTGSAASFASLDLSALDNFVANVSRLTVGACAVNNAVNRPGGILYLARTNLITCAFQTTTAEAGSTTGNSGLVVGDCNQNPGPASFIYLGQANTISADTIGIARQKSGATMQFNGIYANVPPYPSVTFKGFSSALVSILDVSDGVGNSGTTSGVGDLNLAGGLVTAAVDTLNVGRASGATSGSGTTTGTLEFDAGTITANTLNVGLQPVAGTKTGAGTVTVGNNSTIGSAATLVVNNALNLGVNVNNGSTAGTLNINGGMVQANNIVAGSNGASSIVNLLAGTLIVTGTAGSTASPLTTLNLGDGTTLQLSVNGANVTNLVAISVGSGGTTTLKIGSLSGVVPNVTYPLISYTGGDPYGNLSLAALPAGYTGSLVDDSADSIIGLKLTVVPPPPQPAHFTSVSVSGNTLVISATNGVHGGPFVLLGTTNLAKPLGQWTPLLTNSFNGNGNLDLSTNIINPAVPQQFYLISQ